MTGERVNISVGLRLDQKEALELEARKQRVEGILTEKGGNFTVTVTKKEKYTEIVYRADLPTAD